jgi:D-galactarolactone cycloisomerase
VATASKVRDRVRVYASFPALRTEQLLEENLLRIQNAGFTAVKSHDLDENLIALTREIVGDDFTIMLDPSGAWTTPKAQEMIQRLEKCNLLWIEEPIFPMQDHEALHRLSIQTNTKFATGEMNLISADTID